MKKYISGKMSESPTEQCIGRSLINLHTTWDKILLAARCICSTENPKTIYCVGQRTYAQRAIIKFAKEVGAIASPGRFTPGQFTNQVTKSFVEPRLLVVADPKADSPRDDVGSDRWAQDVPVDLFFYNDVEKTQA